MHGDAGHAAGVILGLDPLLLATALFVVTYLVIMSDRLNRAIVALLGAGLLILTGVLEQKEAVAAVDFNTLGLLLGMMLIVNVTRRSGLFQFVAIWSAKKVDAQPWGILLMMSVVTAVFSAFLDNVTTVLLTVPVTLLITDELKVKPYPYLFAQIFTSNIGGTATLIGDPPNIMIGSATGLTFNDFGLALTPVVVVVFVVTMIPIYLIWGRHLTATDENRHHVMNFNERETITDPRLLKQSLVVIALVIAGFMLQRQIQVEPATIAIFGAAVLLLLDNFGKSGEEQSKNVHGALSEAEWITLMFFLGLFVMVYGIQKAGLIDIMAKALIEATRADFNTTAIAILWSSAVLSAFIDNIPFVATMIPLIKAMGPTFGGENALLPLWWALSLGACLGGNGTLIGASANLVVAGLAERSGTTFRFMEYLKIAFPLMLVSIAISHVYLLMRFL
ncbi:MAG: ArsB/NhaD family transporter [Casimicrobiaceae bacterium]